MCNFVVDQGFYYLNIFHLAQFSCISTILQNYKVLSGYYYITQGP